MISIVLASYNGEKYIREQLDSILSQTFTDFEVIVCDDGSTDNTYSIIEEYARKDRRFQIFRNEKNIGFIHNFEKAISLSTGNLIAFCDQDDIWLPNHLEVLQSQLGNKSLSIGGSLLIDEEGNYLNQMLIDRKSFINLPSPDILYLILFHINIFQGAAMLCTRDFLQKALPIPNNINFHDTWFAACSACCNGHVYTPEPIIKYRLHNKNVSGDHKKRKLLQQTTSVLTRRRYQTDRLDYCTALLQRFPEMNNQVKEIILKAFEFHTHRISGTHRWRSIKTTVKYFKLIYATKNRKLLIPRCLGILLKG